MTTTTILLLDTTYLLPAVGITVDKIETEDLDELWNRDYELAISEITIFELSAKAAKYITSGELDPVRVSRGIKTILNDSSIVKLGAFTDKVLSTGFKLREITGDFIDCLLLSSAMNETDCLVTEDEDLRDLKRRRNQNFSQLTESLDKGKFEILNLREVLSKK